MTGQVDLQPHLWGPVFRPLRDESDLFGQIHVDREARTVVWPNGVDLAPDTLYSEAMAAASPPRTS